MAEALMLYETIDAEQIKNIMEGREPGEPKDWNTSPPTTPSEGEDAAESATLVEDDLTDSVDEVKGASPKLH
jgi:cell division protease FtsH